MAAPGVLTETPAETPDDPALAAARAEPLRAPPGRAQWILGAVVGACLLAYPLGRVVTHRVGRYHLLHPFGNFDAVGQVIQILPCQLILSGAPGLYFRRGPVFQPAVGIFHRYSVIKVRRCFPTRLWFILCHKRENHKTAKHGNQNAHR